MELQRGILVSGRGKKGGITLGEGKSQSLVSESRIGPSLAVLIQANVLTFLSSKEIIHVFGTVAGTQ